MKFIFAHPVYLQVIRVKFVYEGHRVKVRRAKTSYLILPPLHFSQSMTTTAQTARSLRHRGVACKHDDGKLRASCLWCLPYISKYMHSRVAGLRLEGSFFTAYIYKAGVVITRYFNCRELEHV